MEAEIALRQPRSYDRATALHVDLRDIAGLRPKRNDFNARLGDIQERHSSKRQFLARLRQAFAEDQG